MICPYCRLAVDDRALVCPHCHRDLTLYQPIAERCAKAERRFETLYEKLGPIEIGPGSVIVASITVAFLSDYISWLPFAEGWKALPFQSLAVLAPILAGLVLGRLRFKMTKFAAMMNGAIAGAGGFATHIMVWAFGKLQSANDDCIDAMAHVTGKFCHKAELMPPHWYVSALTYPILGAFLFYCGHNLGRKTGSEPSSDWEDVEGPSGARASFDAIAAVIGAVLIKVIDHYLST